MRPASSGSVRPRTVGNGVPMLHSEMQRLQQRVGELEGKEPGDRDKKSGLMQPLHGSASKAWGLDTIGDDHANTP